MLSMREARLRKGKRIRFIDVCYVDSFDTLHSCEVAVAKCVPHAVLEADFELGTRRIRYVEVA